MASLADDLQFAVRPVLVQLPRVIDRADRVIATVDDHAWQVGDLVHVADQLVFFEERVVDEVVAFDAGDRQCTLRLGESLDHHRVRTQRRNPPFPGGPRLGRVHLGDLVVTGQALVEGVEQITTFLWRDRSDVVLPVIREQAAGALLIHPVNVLRTGQENPTQDQAVDALGMGLRVSQRQGRTPGTAEHHPLVDAQVQADPLQVCDQIPGGVVFQAGVRGGAAATALVEGDDAVQVGIKEAATLCIAPRTWAAMEKHHRQTFR
ncbi:hypothetical protein D3C73_1083120 [compost metagenome]